MEAFVGHASYLYLCTRPDIGQGVKILSRYTKVFGHRHVEYAKHLLRYLKGTINEGLVYRTGYPYQIFMTLDAGATIGECLRWLCRVHR